MHCYTLRTEQFVPAPLERVFTFFSRPENLEQITPGHLHFSILTPSPIPMRVGTLIDYRIRIRGVPQRWRTLISYYDPPHRFVDEQLRGPYAKWVHRHEFARAAGGTRIVDEVVYALPFGILGRVIHWAFVRHELEAIFEFRRAYITRLFGAEHGHSPASMLSVIDPWT
ncbi:MAG: SRPBCC family protein [Candidatus Hydrogenedentes bacterium]|nr:SRPBCC family protein [Candidatus Hydrogenedentota bacterium]